jgi:heme A synthase
VQQSRTVPNLFRITSAVIFVQLLLGGLLTFNFIDPTVHIIVGLIVFAAAIATMVAASRTKGTLPQLRGMSIGLVALIVVQIILGLETLRTGSQILAWVHFAVAMGIYGMAAAGSAMAFSNWTRVEGGEPGRGKVGT